MDYMMLEPYTNEFKGFVSDRKVMDELGLTKAQFDAHVMYQRLYKGCVLIEADSEKEVWDKIRNRKSFEINQEVLNLYPSSIEIRKIKEKKEKNNMELKETVDLMNSEDYKERFVSEYHQVKIRYDKLKNFCNKIEVETMLGKEVTKHDCPLKLLREQQKYMGLYLSILEKRALIENIVL